MIFGYIGRVNMKPIEQYKLIELIEMYDCKIIAEIGVAQGRTMRTVLRNCKNIEAYWAIDPWVISNEYYWNKFDQSHINSMYLNTAKYYPWFPALRIMKMKSVEAAVIFKKADYQFDLVFIDSCHEEDCIQEDIEAWYPLVKEGGIICGHDYGNKDAEGIQIVVSHYFTGSDYEVIPNTWIWTHRKT